jgi:L-asparaginase
MGMLGVVAGGGPEFFFRPVRRHGTETEFDAAAIETLPKVDLVYSYPGGEGPHLGDATPGLVVATTGYSPSERDAFTELRKKGVVIALVFPSGEHVAEASRGGGDGPRPIGAATPPPLPPTVAVQHLTPQKARILLMLALTRTKDPREVQHFFDEY